MATLDYSLPDLIISKELIERIQFSVSSRNAEAKLGECAAHVFAAQYSDNPRDIKWQYVSSGVACLLRSRELSKNGRRYVWSVSLCLYNASYGVLVWKAKLLPNSEYTAVADNFHIFALGEVDVLVGLMFSSKDKACEINTTYMKWHQERLRDDGKKGHISQGTAGGNNSEPARFRKEMISKPCNFQHIQGTQAIDECMDIEKIKADIIAAFFGLGTKAGRSQADSEVSKSKKKKKEAAKQRLEFKEIELPLTQSHVSPVPPSPAAISPTLESMQQQQQQPPSLTPQSSQQNISPTLLPGGMEQQVADGYQDSGFQGGSGIQDGSTTSEPQYPNPLSPQNSAVLLGYDNRDSNGYPPNSSGYNEPPAQQSSKFRDLEPSKPNYQNPASPAFQEYIPGGNQAGGDAYGYDMSPPRMDMSLEKEFESAFKSTIMTAN